MTRIPTWLYVLFGLLALIAGLLGVVHAPTGLPTAFWAAITVLGAASLANAGFRMRLDRRRA